MTTDSKSKGEQGLPYGLTTEQLLALTHAPRRLLDAAEALQLYAPGREHAIQARAAAAWLDAAFPEINAFWQKLEQDALGEREQRQC